MSCRHGFRRGEGGIVFAEGLLAEKGAEGMPATALEAAVTERLGGTPNANKTLMLRAVGNGRIFRKRGTCPVNANNARYFDTQAHCDAYPLAQRKTAEQVAAERREYQNQRRLERKALGLLPRGKHRRRTEAERPDVPRIAKPAQRGLTGEPIITAQTKVTISPAPVDYRYHVDPTHRGEFSREWQAKRGETATC